MSVNDHPSNRLYNGPVSGFEEALDLVEAQLEHEAAIMRRGGAPLAELEAMGSSYEQVRSAVQRAALVWREEQERARLRAVDRLREDVHAAEAALDDEAARWLALLAASLEDGDYGRLAI